MYYNRKHFTISSIWLNGNARHIPAADGTINATAVTELARWTDCQTQHCPRVTTHSVFSLHVHGVHSTQPQTSKQAPATVSIILISHTHHASVTHINPEGSDQGVGERAYRHLQPLHQESGYG